MNENKRVTRKPIALRSELNKDILDDEKTLLIDNTDIVNEIKESDEPDIIEETEEIENDIQPQKIVKKASSPAFITSMLSVLLIATYLLVPKLLEPAKNIVFNASITVYPLTFLLIILGAKKYSFKEMRKSIITSSIVFILFMLVMCIGLIPISNTDTMNYSIVIQYLFGINNVPVGDITLFYPQLSLVGSILASYIIGHLLYLYIYYALKDHAMASLIVTLSLFISYIIDRTIFMPIYYSNILLREENSFAYFVKCLTGEYFTAILIIIVLVIVFMISKIFEKQPTATS